MDIVPLLTEYRIPFETWGIGKAKSVANLQVEIDTEEARLIVNEGKLVRCVAVLSLDVFCTFKGVTYHLYEDRQQFSDGRKKTRSHLDSSLGEKMLPSESPGSALVLRALNEELGSADNEFVDFEALTFNGAEIEERVSQSYPGLLTRYQFHRATVAILSDNYRDEYVEQQAGRSIFFKWHPV